MEQQTISVTKAGIQATLNARTSVLAAANPVFGRYDRTKTLRQNITISAPIMSRFDLFYVILDELDEERDEAIASHIINIHARRQSAIADVPYSMEKIQAYVKYARGINPVMTSDAKRAVAAAYKLLRSSDSLNHAGSSYRVTVRQLESLIRLSEALARLHLDSQVTRRYVSEAYRLVKGSMMRAESGEVELEPDEGALGAGGDDEEEDYGLGSGGGGGGDDGNDGGDDNNNDGGAGAGGSSNDGGEGAGATPSKGSVASRGAGRSPGAPPAASPSNAASAGAGSSSSASGAAVSGAGPRKKPTVKLNREAFNKMRNFFAISLRKQEVEDASQRQPAGSPVNAAAADATRVYDGSLSFSQLVALWISERGSYQAFESEGERDGEAKLARKVLRKLLADDTLQVVLPDEMTDPESIPEEDRFLKVNPDFPTPGVDQADTSGWR